MLLHMHINNIALIDDIEIDFEDGLNILTGETGAGKSIIIGSLGIGLGGKFPKDILRQEDKDGLVELLFTVDDEVVKNKLDELGIETPDDELLITRRMSASDNSKTARTVNKINDATVTTAKLKDVAAVMIDLHAQHEQQSLLKAAKHLEILDKFGGEQIEKLKEVVAENYREYRDVQDEIEKNTMDESEKNKQMDFLQFQISEIKNANLKIGEDDELEVLYKKAENSKDILELANDIYSSTSGNNRQESVGDLISHALMKMKKITSIDSQAQSMCDELYDIDNLVNDFNNDLCEYMKDMEFDPETFNSIEQRLDLINSLKTKYGFTLNSILDKLDEFEAEYNKLLEYEDYIANLNKRKNELKEKLEKSSKKLSDKRKDIAKELCSLIKKSLEELNFLAVSFDMHFEKSEHFSANGYDQAYFIISTNVGESMRPLYDVASGGELSRVMLAIKSCLANQDETPTLIFDEIDVGISGRTAQKVAEKMQLIALSHQLICITHLPQIAAMADTHYSIEKKVVNNKTITTINKLDKEEDIEEIARLLGGAEVTKQTLLSAQEMKNLADKTKS